MNYDKYNTPSNLSNNCLLTISLNHTLGHTVHEYGHRYTTQTIISYSNIAEPKHPAAFKVKWEKIKNDTKPNFFDNVYFKVSVCLFTWPDSIFVANRLKDNIVFDNILCKTERYRKTSFVTL